jgi:hypothetical protein
LAAAFGGESEEGGSTSSYYQGRLKFAAAVLLAAIPGWALLFLLQDICGFNGSWTWYLPGLLFYTILVFGNAYIEDNSILFSAQDHRSKLRLLAVHCVCLATLFFLIQIALYLKPMLPASLFPRGNRRTSWLELLFLGLLMTVFFIEENWLALKGQKPRKR